jgi:hypothetical protein
VIQSVIVKKHLVLLGFALAATPALLAQSAIGDLFSSDAGVRGAVVLSGNGTRILSGSQVSAGEGTAVLKLERGGQVRICPKTNLSLSADPSGKTLVLGLNAGAMELDYSLRSASDSLITPDFRLQLISPGTFHLAISVAASGDTCLRSLEGNDASVFVAEMMGNDSYQLSPGKNVMFKGGTIAGATDGPPNCGCPEVKAVITPAPEIAKPAPPPLEAPPVQAKNEPAQHMEVDSSFVFRGNEQAPDFYASVSRLSMSSDDSKLTMALTPQVNGPAEPAKAPEKKAGVLHRFGKFLGRVFGR